MNIMRNIFLSILGYLFFIVLPTCVSAQSSKIYNNPYFLDRIAKQLYDQSFSAVALPLLQIDPNSSVVFTEQEALLQNDTKYTQLAISLNANDKKVVDEAEQYVAKTFSRPHRQMLSYHLAEYFYRQQLFDKALKYYDITKPAILSSEALARIKFHQGYAFFVLGKYQDAEPLFNAIRQIPSDANYQHANYYYGFIRFNKKDYDGALSPFQVIEHDIYYKTIVPYYIANIYYLQNERQTALEYALRAWNKKNQYYADALTQLIGHIYFEEKEYTKALPFLESYVGGQEKVSREDLYELTYCYYATGVYNKAILGFKELGGKEDALSQNSMYLLADTYLKMNDKPNARNAFLFSSLNNSHSAQKELSLFNYAKLSFDLGFNDVAIASLKKFVKDYPNADNVQEAKALMVAALASGNNFREALTLIQEIGISNPIVKDVYPRVLYGRAVELLNDKQLEAAKPLIDNVLAISNNQEELQPAYFWKGEIELRLNNYTDAIKAINQYLKNPKTYGEVNIVHARYNLGYAYMRAKNYETALSNFLQVSGSNYDANPIKKDAYIRAADAYFMLKQYAKASAMYTTVIKQNDQYADYAYYQQAVIAGAHGKINDKIKYLKQFNQRYQNSSLFSDANMLMADAYMTQENCKEAIVPLKKIIANNAIELLPQAYLKLGICYFNIKDNTNALEAFRKLIVQYPHTEESDDAVDYVRNIFVAENHPEKYIAFMQQNGKQISFAEKDSIVYAAAFNAYTEENFEGAKSALEKYIHQYQDGRYAIDAHFYLADIALKNKVYEEAFPHYVYVVNRAPNKYAEEATLELARIYYFQKTDYDSAAKYYRVLKKIATSDENRLESMRGLLRCDYRLQNWSSALQNANDLLKEKNIATDDKQMAYMIMAKNKIDSDASESEILDLYKKVFTGARNEYAAEAKYQYAALLLKQGNYERAEKMAFEVINSAGSYDYWIAKSYILLGNIYYAQKDYFNAEATLKSVIEHVKDDSLVNEAKLLLDKIVNEKQQKSKLK